MNILYKILINHPVVPLFLIMNLAIVYWAHRRTCIYTFEDYVFAGYSLPTGVLVMTVLATFIGSGELNLPGRIARLGILASFDTLSIFCSFIIIGKLIAGKLTNFHGAISLGDLMHVFYGRWARLMAGFVSVLVSVFVITVQMRAIGSVSVYLLGMDPALNPVMAIVGFGMLIVVYSVWGGIRAVTYTDVWQALMALLVVGWVTKTFVQETGGISLLFQKVGEQHPDKLKIVCNPDFLYYVKRSSFWWTSGMFTLSLPMLQRMLMVRDKKRVRNIWYVSACFHLLFSCMLILVGLGATIDETDAGVVAKSENLLLHVIWELFGKNAWMLDIVFVGLLGILFSTVDSFLHATGIAFMHDIIEPIRSLLGMRTLNKRHKIAYARLSIALLGSVAMVAGARSGIALFSEQVYEWGVFIYVMVLGPMMLGLLGLKTDIKAGMGFCGGYLVCLSLLYQLGWAMEDIFHGALLAGVLGFITLHVWQYKGLVMVRRGMHSVAEETWCFSWRGTKDRLYHMMSIMSDFPCMARGKILKSSAHPLASSFMIFALYMFSSFIFSPTMRISNYIMAIRALGLVLCCGLIVEDIWPDALKPYFPCFWCFTLLYCLPFSGTLIFLHTYCDAFATAQWVMGFALLMFLVNRYGFVILSILGISLALGVWYLVVGSFPYKVCFHIETGMWCGFLAFFVCVVLFKREDQDKVYWEHIANKKLSNEVTDPLQMLEGLGYVLQNSFAAGKIVKNAEGEKGFWIKNHHYQFLHRFAGPVTEKSQEVKKDMKRFSRFIEQHILGAFKQESASIRDLVEKGIAQAVAKHRDKVQVKFVSKGDFRCKVLVNVFPNVIANVIENAAVHGHASEVEVSLYEAKREVRIRDNGRGIPAAILPYLFELSYTGDGGCGLGLPFLRMVVEAAGGRVMCYAKHGVKSSFSEFVISLP